MLYWGGFSGLLLVSRVYNRAVDMFLQLSAYVMLLLFFIIHWSWNFGGFNHIKIGLLIDCFIRSLQDHTGNMQFARRWVSISRFVCTRK